MAKAKIDKNTCIGCGACTATCPFGAITLGADGKAAIDAAKCQGCGACEAGCPVSAIKVK